VPEPAADASRPSPSARLFKRLFDVVASAIALCLCLPLLLILALVVGLGAGRPVIHREYRVGRHGVTFPQFKFRTLRPGTAVLRSVAPEDDPRIVGAGRCLRHWRLDELPQLFNVLRGDMSLVGPRPMPRAHADSLPGWQRDIILSVRPGLTDTAALHFLAEDQVLAGTPDPEALYLSRLLPAKARMQVDSLQHWSPLEDLRVLGATVLSVWSPRAREQSVRALHRLLVDDPSVQ
jgi:lipopolysaccharide/colanic/teichoic acid biosynthesis glycosyltransferase